MQDLTRIYRLINILSLDIVAGAIVSVLFFAKIFDVHILPCGVAALGLAVWIVYTADHLMYLFFRITCGVELKQLPAWEEELKGLGLMEFQSHLFFHTFIKSALFRKH